MSKTFFDAIPQTPEEWEDDFRRDADPGSEIMLWLRMAYVYIHFTEGSDLNTEKKKDICHVVLRCCNGKENVLATVSPATLSRKEVKEIVDYFFSRTTEEMTAYYKEKFSW